jgi:hypothetical protein
MGRQPRVECASQRVRKQWKKLSRHTARERRKTLLRDADARCRFNSCHQKLSSGLEQGLEALNQCAIKRRIFCINSNRVDQIKLSLPERYSQHVATDEFRIFDLNLLRMNGAARLFKHVWREIGTHKIAHVSQAMKVSARAASHIKHIDLATERLTKTRHHPAVVLEDTAILERLLILLAILLRPTIVEFTRNLLDLLELNHYCSGIVLIHIQRAQYRPSCVCRSALDIENESPATWSRSS